MDLPLIAFVQVSDEPGRSPLDLADDTADFVQIFGRRPDNETTEICVAQRP